MKLIIAGGRDYHLTREDMARLDDIVGVEEVLSGMCRGADKDGWRWARSRGIVTKEFPADWDAHGKAAGPIRNKVMVACADAVALFPGGRGTESMYRDAVKAGLRIFDFRTIDLGPQRSPASVAQINAQVKQAEREVG